MSKDTKLYSFRLSNNVRKRAEKLGYKMARFINEAILEKLGREEIQNGELKIMSTEFSPPLNDEQIKVLGIWKDKPENININSKKLETKTNIINRIDSNKSLEITVVQPPESRPKWDPMFIKKHSKENL